MLECKITQKYKLYLRKLFKHKQLLTSFRTGDLDSYLSSIFFNSDASLSTVSSGSLC